MKQCFENKCTTTKKRTLPLGAKIQIRNETIYKPIRSKRAWKLKYDRHERQTTRGFFSPVAKPYETFGELELDLRELVLKTLGAKVRIVRDKRGVLIILNCSLSCILKCVNVLEGLKWPSAALYDVSNLIIELIRTCL